MTASAQNSSPPVGHSIGLVLGLVVVVCLMLIGVTGYLKYQIDQAEITLAAPASALKDNQTPVEKLQRSLGYSGFIETARKYAATHDSNLVPDMKAQLQDAKDVLAQLPEKTPSETRRDLEVLKDNFDVALQKANKASLDPSASFTTADLIPLYAALPVLNERASVTDSAERLRAQQKLQFWSMLLTLVTWSSLIIAAAMAVGIYLSWRDRNSAPLRALAQSVKNMAQGDLRTSLWGMERSDSIGDLARAIDLARYHFSHLPDLTLNSDEGPLRLRFEGQTKSLFESMMQILTRDSEKLKQQTASLTEGINQQQDALTLISSRVEAVLHNIEKRGLDGNQQLRQVLNDMMGSTQSLQHAQEHAADQLNRIVPYMQERAHGVAEIAQITGKQVAQALQTLTLTERDLRSNADQGEETIRKLALTADDLSGRLFGAVNLLQASGKVLSETTEATHSRMNEAIDNLNARTGGVALNAPSIDSESRLEAIIEILATLQEKIDMQRIAPIPTVVSGEAALASTEKLSEEIRAGVTTTSRDVEKLRADLTDMLTTHVQASVSHLAKAITHGFEATEVSHGKLREEFSALTTTTVRASASDLADRMTTGFEAVESAAGKLREEIIAISTATARMQTKPSTELVTEVQDRWFQMAAQIEATRTDITQIMTQQIDRLETRLADQSNAAFIQKQTEQQTQILTELVSTLGILDAHMQQLKVEIKLRA